MIKESLVRVTTVLMAALACVFGPCAASARAQSGPNTIEGRLTAGSRLMANVRVRLILQDGMRPVAETISRSDGQFVFANIMEGNYVIEVEETEHFQSASQHVELRQLTSDEGTTFRVFISMTPKPPVVTTGPRLIAADVDVDVPDDARSRYDSGVRALDERDEKRARAELEAAIKIAPTYYAARLTLGRLLRSQSRFDDARRVLEPLLEIAPKRADPRIELGMVDIARGKRTDAARVLEEAVALEPSSWAAHLYLGYALVDEDDEAAEPHFWTALKLNEKEAVEAHLALARLAYRYGYIKDAVEQLDTYLAVAPNATDADDVRKLAEKLRRELAKSSKP